MTTPDPTEGKNLVHRVEKDEDPRDVYATTYQMRNFYLQLRDALPATLDVMNYIQHYWVVKRFAKRDVRVLDICCGRGLLVPLLRYHAKTIAGYTGVDIEPKNVKYLTHRVTDNKPLPEPPEDYYPFPVDFVWADAAEMGETGLKGREFDLLVYTSSLEHMHHDAGLASLHQARAVASDQAVMVLTTPNTPEGQDGYDTQYRAHVYEWSRSEILEGLSDARWKVIGEWGVEIRWGDLLEAAHPVGLGQVVENLARWVPKEFLTPVFAPMFPEAAREIGFVCIPEEA